jgi:hypothetical protein
MGLAGKTLEGVLTHAGPERVVALSPVDRATTLQLTMLPAQVWVVGQFEGQALIAGRLIPVDHGVLLQKLN